jgi:hypothetical protein
MGGSYQGRLGGFYYSMMLTYCQQHRKPSPVSDYEWVFNNDNNTDLINGIVGRLFFQQIFSSVIQLFEWFICEKIVVPENGDIQPEHHRFLFYAYTEGPVQNGYFILIFMLTDSDRI